MFGYAPQAPISEVGTGPMGLAAVAESVEHPRLAAATRRN
jgi:hypothetical protein